MWKCTKLRLVSEPGESERDFRVRVREAAREKGDIRAAERQLSDAREAFGELYGEFEQELGAVRAAAGRLRRASVLGEALRAPRRFPPPSARATVRAATPTTSGAGAPPGCTLNASAWLEGLISDGRALILVLDLVFGFPMPGPLQAIGGVSMAMSRLRPQAADVGISCRVPSPRLSPTTSASAPRLRPRRDVLPVRGTRPRLARTRRHGETQDVCLQSLRRKPPEKHAREVRPGAWGGMRSIDEHGRAFRSAARMHPVPPGQELR